VSDDAPVDPRLSFDSVAEIYDEIRPGYPSSMFDDLFRLLPASPRVLEVGPGTGQATRDLLSRGAIVHGIELGSRLAAKLRKVLPSPDLTITIGDFEHVTLTARSFDAVFSATAYHWISPRSQLDKPHELLAPGGLVAIVDANHVESSDDNGFFAAAQHIYERHGEGRTGPPLPTRDAVDPPIRAALDHDTRFTNVEVRRYDWNQTYTAADFRKLMTSYSGTQLMQPAARQAFLDDFEAFVEHHFDGHVTRPIVVTLTTAALAT
jgi:SAM-dependent methyltransferase